MLSRCAVFLHEIQLDYVQAGGVRYGPRLDVRLLGQVSRVDPHWADTAGGGRKEAGPGRLTDWADRWGREEGGRAGETHRLG